MTKFLVLQGILAALFLDIGKVTLLSCLLCQFSYVIPDASSLDSLLVDRPPNKFLAQPDLS